MSSIVFERVNPPGDVTQALAALDKACHAWTPTPFIILNNHPQAPDPDMPPPLDWSVTPQMACSMMVDPYYGMMPSIEAAGMMLMILLVLVCFFAWVTRIYRLPGVLFRLATRHWTRQAQ